MNKHFSIFIFQSINGTQSFPRGAGRARLFRPELLSRPISNEVAESTRASTPSDSGIASVNSDRTNDSNASEVKELKRGSKGMLKTIWKIDHNKNFEFVYTIEQYFVSVCYLIVPLYIY